MPNFFDTLRETDIEDYIDDENDFAEVGHEHLSEQAISNFKRELNERKTGNKFESIKTGSTGLPKLEDFVMIGDPRYQAYGCIDYQIAFNATDNEEKKQLKYLMNLPLIPPSQLHKVKLRHIPRTYATYEEDDGALFGTNANLNNDLK